MRDAWFAGLALLLTFGSGCQTAEEKCEQARTAALSEWDGYLQVLEQGRAKAAAAQKAAAIKLVALDSRILPLARQRADARYPRHSGAWLRANTIAYNELCAADAECSEQKHKQFEAGVALADLDERLALARAARDAARGDGEGAAKASAAAILHPEYPQLKQAQARVGELRERCQGLQPAAGEALSAAPR